MKMSTHLLNCIAQKIGVPKSRILSWDMHIYASQEDPRPKAELIVQAKGNQPDNLYTINKIVPYGDLLDWFKWQA